MNEHNKRWERETNGPVKTEKKSEVVQTLFCRAHPQPPCLCLHPTLRVIANIHPHQSTIGVPLEHKKQLCPFDHTKSLVVTMNAFLVVLLSSRFLSPWHHPQQEKHRFLYVVCALSSLDSPFFLPTTFRSLASLNQAGLLSYAVLDLEQDLGLPVVQLAQLVKLDNTSCKLAHITVIHSSQNALSDARK